MKQYYFISGLPRSGSTLLSSILKQNPRFSAGISSPLLTIFRSLFESCNDGLRSQTDHSRTERMLRSTVSSFYEDNQSEVIFDTNRLWTNLLPQLKQVFPYTKVIVCVRDINRILESFERLHQNNPMSISTIFPKTVDMHVYSRMTSLMSEGGIVRLPYDSVKSSLCGIHSSMMYFCEYDILTKNPEGVLRSIYNFIEQPYYHHDFNSVEMNYEKEDSEWGMSNLHKVRKKVTYEERPFTLPPDILTQYNNLEVWR
jgi:sulfotransferase